MNTTVKAAPAATAIDLEPAAAQPLALVEPERPPTHERLRANVITPADLLRIAVERGDADLDRMERLANMVREWRAEEAKLAYRRAFAEFTALGLVIPKSKRVEQRKKDGGPGPSYWQTEFDHVCAILKPALGARGIGVRFDNEFQRATDGGIAWCSVTCYLEHVDGYSEKLKLEGPPDDSGAKNPLQEMQSSATFLMRHALMAITGTAQQGADNDGRGARGSAEDGSGKAATLAPDDDKLILDGAREANAGTAPLNKWWSGLTEAQRNSVGSERFGKMRKAARLVDTGGVA
jgi:hypothetical protein